MCQQNKNYLCYDQNKAHTSLGCFFSAPQDVIICPEKGNPEVIICPERGNQEVLISSEKRDWQVNLEQLKHINLCLTRTTKNCQAILGKA